VDWGVRAYELALCRRRLGDDSRRPLNEDILARRRGPVLTGVKGERDTRVGGNPLELLAQAQRGGEADGSSLAVAQSDRRHRLQDGAGCARAVAEAGTRSPARIESIASGQVTVAGEATQGRLWSRARSRRKGGSSRRPASIGSVVTLTYSHIGI
jgi:hypothetical protein